MNQLKICHQFEGVDDIYIDAFRALKHKTSDIRNAFILTHYHADHYSGLPRGNAYSGPAKIHCTPATANLLREIHDINDKFIVPHEYGSTWIHNRTEVTFYDANHCPGAAIIFAKVKLKENSFAHHLHTGDMRFHEKFKSYPLLRQAVAERKLDNLYLDTTYAKPKHTFLPQEEAIDTIASQVKDLLHSNNDIVNQKKKSFFQRKVKSDEEKLSERNLVLLSCYSIGKEKVLWKSAIDSKQLVYCNNTKLKMLACIHDHKEVDEASGIIEICTDDRQKSDIHVINMSMAGRMHPYFQANFDECALYAHRMNKGYNKVVAFIPTGWADASKYNRENAVAAKTVDLKELLDGSKINGNEHKIKVEVRLVAYSEHSSYNELRACVEYMKPKRIIPTVFSGEKDYQAIEKRFRDLVDSQRAKQAFINSIGFSRIKTGLPKREIGTQRGDVIDVVKESVIKKKADSMTAHAVPSLESSNSGMKRKLDVATGNFAYGVKKNVLKKEAGHRKESGPLYATKTSVKKITKGNNFKRTADDMKVSQLVSMGFNANKASESLIAKNNDLEKAIEWLLRKM